MSMSQQIGAEIKIDEKATILHFTMSYELNQKFGDEFVSGQKQSRVARDLLNSAVDNRSRADLKKVIKLLTYG